MNPGHNSSTICIKQERLYPTREQPGREQKRIQQTKIKQRQISKMRLIATFIASLLCIMAVNAYGGFCSGALNVNTGQGFAAIF
jgi:hypothetical protein